MKNTTGTIFQWYVERNGDPQTRRSFTSESLAQEYASIYDRISDGDTTTRIYLAPTIEMVEIAKAVGEEHALKGVYAVVEESVNKHQPKKANGGPWGRADPFEADKNTASPNGQVPNFWHRSCVGASRNRHDGIV